MPDYHVKRCFVALPLDDAARADCAEIASGIHIDGLRITKPQNLHVTLKFLGDVDDPDQPRLVDALSRLASDSETFELRVTGLEYLPTPRRPRVLAAATDCPKALSTLFLRVEDAVSGLGFQREGRAYHPHVTLGRFRKPPRDAPAPDSFACDAIEIPVDRAVLMQSDLDHFGPTYTPLADFPLRPSGALPTAR